MSKGRELDNLKNSTFWLKSLFFIFSLGIVILGLFMCYVWGDNIWVAVSGGGIRVGGSIPLRMSSIQYSSGFGFWSGLILSLSMMILGLIFILAGCIGLLMAIKLFWEVAQGKLRWFR
ncbi:hypothetical protein [Enterobacter sp. KBR-315C3_2022]|uniref:hypothetical protein n=1 Tax=Enterobacter sp. KBR-315C3_2022 TaxID=3242494 RepID=UPI0035295000